MRAAAAFSPADRMVLLIGPRVSRISPVSESIFVRVIVPLRPNRAALLIVYFSCVVSYVLGQM